MLKSFIRKSKWALPVVVAGALALGTVGTALADTPAPTPSTRTPTPTKPAVPKQGLFGAVTAKTNNSLTIQTKDGTTAKLNVTADTKFQVKGVDNASLANVAQGDRVAVLAQGQGDAQTALRVMVVPGEPQREHRVLTVVEINGKTIVAEDAQGNRITVTLDHELSADVKGMLITFIGDKSQQSDRFKANVEVKIEQVVKRLEDHSKKLQDDVKGEGKADVKAKKEQQLDELKAKLEANMQRHLDQMAQVIAKAPEQAKEALKKAMENSQKGYQQALEAVGEAKADVQARLQMRVVVGAIQSYNVATGEVVVATPNGAKLTLKLTKDSEVSVDGRHDTSQSIVANLKARVKYNDQTMTISEIDLVTGAGQGPGPRGTPGESGKGGQGGGSSATPGQGPGPRATPGESGRGGPGASGTAEPRGGPNATVRATLQATLRATATATPKK